jgi:2-dehydropantoate 2-reductase
MKRPVMSVPDIDPQVFAAQPWQAPAWPNVAVVGAGAVGGYFGAKLCAAGARVTLIGRPAPMQAIANEGLRIQGRTIDLTVHPRTATELSAVADADLVLLCVKTLDTASTARALKPHLKPGAVLVSLQNGVDNVDVIEQASGLSALPCAVYVAVITAAPALLHHHGRGDLVIGSGSSIPKPGAAPADLARDPRPAAVAQVFERAGVSCRVSAEVAAELWTKFVMNCALNAISALGPATYGTMVEDAAVKRLVGELVDETVAVARAVGVHLAEDLREAAFRLAQAMHGMYSSTAQDLMRARRTEIESLNGLVVRLAQVHGIEVPLNRMLHGLVRLREAASAQTGQTGQTGQTAPKAA